MSLSQNLRVVAIAIPVLFVIGIILALRGTAKQEDLEVDKKALESTFLKKESQIHENIGDNVGVDPINFQIEQPDDTNGDSSQNDINQIINKLMEKEAKLTQEQLDALKTTGNDMKGFEEQMTTPDFLEIDPFAIEATTTTQDIKLSLHESTQGLESIQTEPIKIFDQVPELESNGDPTPIEESTIGEVTPPQEERDLRRQDTFVYNVSNVLNFAPNQKAVDDGNPEIPKPTTSQKIEDSAVIRVTDPITRLLSLTQNNSTVIPETNTTVYENGTVIGQLATPTASPQLQSVGFLELHTELPTTNSPKMTTNISTSEATALNQEQLDAQALVQKLDETGSIEGPQSSFFRPAVLEVPVLTSVRVVNATQNDNGVKTLFDVGAQQAQKRRYQSQEVRVQNLVSSSLMESNGQPSLFP